jgi:hypothetical protein
MEWCEPTTLTNKLQGGDLYHGLQRAHNKKMPLTHWQHIKGIYSHALISKL